MFELYENVIKEEVGEFFAALDKSNLNKALTLILDAENGDGRVHVTGIGKPSYVAGYTASLLSSTGTPAYFLDGTEAVHGSSGQVKPGDVVIGISNSGETKELLYSLQTLKNNGVLIIGISRDESTSLSVLSDVCLCTMVQQEGDDLNKPPRASIINQLLMVQSLSILLQEAKELTPKSYVKWHPGGAIGESLGV